MPVRCLLGVLAPKAKGRSLEVPGANYEQQRLWDGCIQSVRRSGQSPRLHRRGSEEHQAFMPITAWLSDTRACSQLSGDENQASLAPGLP